MILKYFNNGLLNMEEEYEWEEFADEAVVDLTNFIRVEEQLVKEEHSLFTAVQFCGYIIAPLDERIPENMVHLHALNGTITDRLLGIQKLLESSSLRGLKIVEEEDHNLQKLKEDVEHRDYRAVIEDIKSKGQFERLSIDGLKELHSKLIRLMKPMKRSKFIKAIEEDLTKKKDKEKYKKLEEYYFLQIYKIIRAYERIFRHLWRKERKLARR